MRTLFAVATLIFSLAVEAFGGSVRWGVVSIGEFSGFGLYDCDHALYVSAEGVTGGNMAGYKTLNQSPTEAVLSGQNWATTASYGHMWRQLLYGDIVNENSVKGDHDDYFFCFWNDHYDDEFSDLSVRRNETVYLGFFIEDDAMNALFGWVGLSYNGTEVYVVNSAIDIGSDPIQVGMVPEPMTVGLLLAGIAAVALRRRRQDAGGV